jgi:hypothetical protein
MPEPLPIIKPSAVVDAARNFAHCTSWCLSHWLTAKDYEEMRQAAAVKDDAEGVSHYADKCESYENQRDRYWQGARQSGFVLIGVARAWSMPCYELRALLTTLHHTYLPGVCGVDPKTCLPPNFEPAETEAAAIGEEAEIRLSMEDCNVQSRTDAVPEMPIKCEMEAKNRHAEESSSATIGESSMTTFDDATDPKQVLEAAQEYEDHVDGFAMGSAVRLPVGFTPKAERLEQLRQFLIEACECFGANADWLKMRKPSGGVHIIAGEDVEQLCCLARSERDYREAMDAMTPQDAPNQPARRLCGALRALRKSAEKLVCMVRERRKGSDFYDPEPPMLFDRAFHRAVELNRGIGKDLAYGLSNPGHLETEISFYLDELSQAAGAAMRPFRENGWQSRECVFQGGDLASIWVEDDDLQSIEELLPRSDAMERRLALLAVPGGSTSPQLLVSGGHSQRSRMTKVEANIKARDFLRENPGATSRELATGIGCSTGLVSKLPAWQAVKEQRNKGRQPKKAGTMALTPKMEQVVGVEGDALAKLIGEQEADAEPSPLVNDAAGDRTGAPRRAKIYRKP